MKRMGWLLCVVALFAATVVVAQEGSPPVAPVETAAPPSSDAPALDNVETVVPAPPGPPVTAVPPPAPPSPPAPPVPAFPAGRC